MFRLGAKCFFFLLSAQLLLCTQCIAGDSLQNPSKEVLAQYDAVIDDDPKLPSNI